MKFYIFYIFLLLFISSGFSQTLVINEVSNGSAGNQEYIEFIVVDDAASYICNSGEPPCVDIRGWIIDDNSGYHGAGGVAAGCNRFSNDPFWQCIPLGTIILVYNNADPNSSLPPNDLLMTDNNCQLVIPINNTQLFETNPTTPGNIACSYPTSGWIAGGDWNTITLANTGDCARLVNLAGCEVSSVCWAGVNQNTQIYFNSGNSGTDNVWYFNGGNPSIQANWSEGCADPSTCGANNQTPGSPNNALNSAYIAQFNNNCLPIQPLSLTVTGTTSQSCTCDGSASISATGSIGPYTYAWFDNFNVPLGQTNATATNLCSGNYYCVVTSSIDCKDTIPVFVGSICSNYGTFATATMVQNCVNNQFYNTTWGSLPDQINPSGVLFDGYNYGPFFQNSNTLILRGGEVKTFKNPGANVCGAKLYYTVYTVGNQPANPVFIVLDLPFKESCNVAPNSFPTGGPCFNATDQKWAKENYNIDLTTYPPGDYVLEVYYTVPGSFTSTSACNDTIYVSNNGNNYKALFQIKPLPLISGGLLNICPGNSSTLTSNYTIGNTWSTSSTNQSISVNTSGTYTLTVNLNNNCPNLSDNETVTVYATPTVEAGPNQTTCGGAGSISLNGVIGGSATGASWSSPSGSFSSSNSLTTTYTPTITSGVVTIILTAIGPCPSVQDQLVLLVNAAPTVDAGTDQTICAGSIVNLSGAFGGSPNSILWTASSGTFSNTTSTTSTYTPTITSGSVTLTLTASGPCPSVSDQVIINVNAPTTPTFTQISPICSGGSITLPSTSLNGISGTWAPSINNSATTTYTFTPTAGQCATTTSMTIVVNSPTTPTFNQVAPICSGNTFSLPSTSLNGITGAWSPEINNSSTTNYTFTPSAGQCANNTTMNVVVNSNYFVNVSQTVCPSQLPYVWNGITFNGPGTQSANLISINSCDSIVNMTLNVSSTVTSTTNISVCNSDLPYVWNGLTLNAAGSQSVNLTALSGCDSTATLNLSTFSPQSSAISSTVCQSQIPYTWNGLTFNGPGSQTATLQDQNGCDSLATLTLQVANTLSSSNSLSICATELPYTWNGLTFSSAGNQTATLQSAGGCDSLATLSLSVNPTYNEVENMTICSNETPYLWNGLSLSATTSQSVTLNSINGCDSIVTLNLSVLPVFSTSLDSTICQSELPFFWSGLTFNAAGTQILNNTSVNGCDSIVQLNLQVISISQILSQSGGEYCLGEIVEPFQVVLSGGSPFNLSYSVNGVGQVISSSSDTIYLGNEPGTYLITSISNGICSTSLNELDSIVVHPLPDANFSGGGYFCNTLNEVNVNVNVSGTAPFSVVYSINGIYDTLVISNLNPWGNNLPGVNGYYELFEVFDAYCSNTVSDLDTFFYYININELEVTPSDTTLCFGRSVNLTAIPNSPQGVIYWYDSPQLVNPVFSGSVYSFSPNLGVDTLYIQSVIDFCPNIPAVVYVTAIDCEILVPTAFTPDDDNVNDTWALNEIDTYYPNNVVSVYNRWGNLIYQSEPGKYESNPWNGKYNDEPLPIGSYYFIIEFGDGVQESKNGTVTIIK